MNSPYYNDLSIDYKSRTDGFITGSETKAKRHWFAPKSSSLLQHSVASRKLGRRGAPQGAVRVQPRPGRRLGRVTILILALAGTSAILATTASTNSGKQSSFKVAVLDTIKEVTVPTPTFRFHDADAVASHDLPIAVSMSQTPPLMRPTAQAFAPQAVAHSWPVPTERYTYTAVDSFSSTPLKIPTQTAKAKPRLPAAINPETVVFTSNADKDKAVGIEIQTLTENEDTVATNATEALEENTSLTPLDIPIQAQALTPSEEEVTVPAPTTEIVTVRSGDTLSELLAATSISTAHRLEILANDLIQEHLTNLRIGTDLHFSFAPSGDLHKLHAKVAMDTRVHVFNNGDEKLDIIAEHLPVEHERVVTSGEIDQSLYLAAEKANMKQSTIMALSDIFEWELDFARDIRKGDRFSIIYDRLYRDGEYIGDGDILAAEFIRGQKRYTAVRFTDDTGHTDYYSHDGHSKRRAFMRHPVDVVRITSRFDPKRMHPVLHRIRAHKGVDYGSPYGSPIYATADGKVQFAGDKNAYGKTVILQHGDNRSTLYAHMARIAKVSKSGSRVKRGDIIGYVGNTGRVTGTHLHYEFRIAGKHVDPLTVELPGAPPLDKKYHAQLKAKSGELFAQMRSVKPTNDEHLALRD